MNTRYRKHTGFSLLCFREETLENFQSYSKEPKGAESGDALRGGPVPHPQEVTGKGSVHSWRMELQKGGGADTFHCRREKDR